RIRAVLRGSGDDEVGRERHGLPVLLAEVEDLAGDRDLVFLEQRLADGKPDRANEVIRDGSTDEQRVRRLRERAEGVDLSRDLRSAENRREGPLRVAEPPKRADSPLEQKAGALFAYERRSAADGGVGASRRAERVVDAY